MSEDKSLRQRYLRRFKIGLLLLAFLAFPAILHSNAAVTNLFNIPADWIPDSLPEKIEFNDFVRRFSVADVVMISWEGADLESESLDAASAVLQPLCDQPEPPSQTAPVIAADQTGERLRKIREVCQTDTPLRWARSGSSMLRDMMAAPASLSRGSAVARLRGNVVGPIDGHAIEQSCLVVAINRTGLTHRRDLLPMLKGMLAESTGLQASEFSMVGGPFEGATVDAASIRTVNTFAPPSAVIAAVICFLCLRSIPLTASILVVAVVGQGLVLAMVHYTGTPMNAVLVVLPPLVFVLTVSSGIHLSNYYIDVLHEFPELGRSEAAARAMRAGVPPCLLATVTTVIGLGSLMLVRIEPIRIFGGVACAGVVTTLALLLLILPGAMVLTGRRKRNEASRETDTTAFRRWGHQWLRTRIARPWPLVVVFAILGGGFAFGLSRLETSVSLPRMFSAESDLRKQYAWFEEHLGATVSGDLTLTFAPLGEDDDPLQRLDLVKRAHLAALHLPSVHGALSAVSFVPTVPTKRSIAATATRGVVRQLIRDPSSSLGRLAFIHRDDEAEVWRISVRMLQGEETDLRKEIASVRRAVEEELVGVEIPVRVSFTGSVAIVQTAQQVLLHDLFRSFLSAFGIVAVVMMILLRSVLGGMIAMIPNLFPTVALFGLMGLIRSPLDIGSVMTASVALGIAVDDTVHLLSRFGSRRARGFGQIRAAFGALGQCGWAMLQTTLVCGLSLMAYWFSDFVPTSRFALLMFGLLTAALAGDVLLLPALMSSPLGRWLSRSLGADAKAEISSETPDANKRQDLRRLPSHRDKRKAR